MASHISTTKLSKTLVAQGVATATFTARGINDAPMAPGFSIGDETYGKASYLYIGTPDKAARAKLTRALEAAGAKVGRNYSPKGSTVEVRVSYFRGWHWDE